MPCTDPRKVGAPLGQSVLFCCPVCAGALEEKNSILRCKKGHSYDVAKEGYVHLLPIQRKHTKEPGDSKEMVAARHSFLQAGHYAPLAQALCEILQQALAGVSAPFVLDAGCGEGYYTQQLACALGQNGAIPQVAALDISKAAVRLAARQKHTAVQYAVASSFALPVAPRAVHALVNIFSPVALEEFTRVLRPGGVFVYAVPGARHLYGLKEILYDTPYENPVQDIHYKGFTQLRRVSVGYDIAIQGAQVQNLFAMTPYFWKTPKDGAQRLAACQSLATPVAFDFLVLQKNCKK